MTRRTPSFPIAAEPGLKPSQGDTHEALVALVRLLARAEAQRSLAEAAPKQEQDHD